MPHDLPISNSSPPHTFSCHVYVGPAADAPGIVRARIATLPDVIGEGSSERTALAAVVGYLVFKNVLGTFTDKNLPQEINRDTRAISFVKGCYLGQETVARIDALGHVNQQLACVRFFGNELPQPGVELLRDGRAVGKVTSAAYSPALDTFLALAMVRREANAVGTRLTSPAGDCEVVQLPVVN